MKDRRTKTTKGSKEQRREFKLDDILDNRKTQVEEILQKDDTEDDSYGYVIQKHQLFPRLFLLGK